MRASTVLTATDAYPDQSEEKVRNLGLAFRSAVSAVVEDSRSVDFLFEDMTEGMFDRGHVFTVSDMNRLRLALASCLYPRTGSPVFRKGRQCRDAVRFVGVVVEQIQPFSPDSFTTVYSAACAYMAGGRSGQ